MNLSSILEDRDVEKRIAITPEIAKKYISLGFNLTLPKNYGVHLGFADDEYKNLGIRLLDDEEELIKGSEIIIQLGLPKEDKLLLLKENQTLIGSLNVFLNSNNINFLVQVGGVTQVSINYSGATITSNLKLAFAYKENDFVAYVNGTQAGTDTSGSTYSSGTLTTFSFDNSVGADKLVAKLNQVLLFPTRLSNAELQALTTI